MYKLKKYLSFYLGLITCIILVLVFKNDITFAVLSAYIIGYYDLPRMLLNLIK